jgi:hypothetical protein
LAERRQRREQPQFFKEPKPAFSSAEEKSSAQTHSAVAAAQAHPAFSIPASKSQEIKIAACQQEQGEG